MRPLLKIYLLLLIPFWLFGWANYSDRYAYNAWASLPLILAAQAYPLAQKASSGALLTAAILATLIFTNQLS